jgi:hypothetical protein
MNTGIMLKKELLNFYKSLGLCTLYWGSLEWGGEGN